MLLALDLEVPHGSRKEGRDVVAPELEKAIPIVCGVSADTLCDILAKCPEHDNLSTGEVARSNFTDLEF